MSLNVRWVFSLNFDKQEFARRTEMMQKRLLLLWTFMTNGAKHHSGQCWRMESQKTFFK